MACVNFVSLCHTAGTNVFIDFQYTEDDGTPIDITGVNAQMQYLINANDIASVFDLTGGVTSGIDGLGQFILTPAESQALLPITLDAIDSIVFKSNIMFTYPDTTVEVVAGIDSTYHQNLIR